jgi:hypothetical protein
MEPNGYTGYGLGDGRRGVAIRYGHQLIASTEYVSSVK